MILRKYAIASSQLARSLWMLPPVILGKHLTTFSEFHLKMLQLLGMLIRIVEKTAIHIQQSAMGLRHVIDEFCTECNLNGINRREKNFA